MKIITILELTKVWIISNQFMKAIVTKNPFRRQVNQSRLRIHPETNQFYVVRELESMEVVQSAMAEDQGAVEEVGVDQSTIQIIALDN